jgi:hypothetical protein
MLPACNDQHSRNRNPQCRLKDKVFHTVANTRSYYNDLGDGMPYGSERGAEWKQSHHYGTRQRQLL